MKSENINQIQKEDKGAFKKFLILVFIGMIVGATIGFLSNYVENIAKVIASSLQNVLFEIASYANICFLVVIFIPIIVLYQKSRKLYKVWDGENEEELQKIDVNLSYAMWLTSIAIIISFFFFAIGFWNIINLGYSVSGGYLALWLGGFVLIMICIVLGQQKIVNFTKEINPEKEGSVFDHKFAKKWEESCDEAEKLAIYKAGYKSYKAVTYTCMILWMFCIMATTLWDFGLMPITFVSIIWIVQTTSYSFECIRLDKQRK